MHPESRLRLAFRPLILPALQDLQLPEEMRQARRRQASVAPNASNQAVRVDHRGERLRETYGSLLTTVSSKRPKGPSIAVNTGSSTAEYGTAEDAMWPDAGTPANVHEPPSTLSRRASWHTGTWRRRSSFNVGAKAGSAQLRRGRRASLTSTLLHAVAQPDQVFVLKESDCVVLRERLRSIVQSTRQQLSYQAISADRELYQKLESMARDVEAAVEVLDVLMQLQLKWLFLMHLLQRDHAWRRRQQQTQPMLHDLLVKADTLFRTILLQLTHFPQCNALLEAPVKQAHLCGEELRFKLDMLQSLLDQAGDGAWSHLQQELASSVPQVLLMGENEGVQCLSEHHRADAVHIAEPWLRHAFQRVSSFIFSDPAASNVTDIEMVQCCIAGLRGEDGATWPFPASLHVAKDSSPGEWVHATLRMERRGLVRHYAVSLATAGLDLTRPEASLRDLLDPYSQRSRGAVDLVCVSHSMNAIGCQQRLKSAGPRQAEPDDAPAEDQAHARQTRDAPAAGGMAGDEAALRPLATLLEWAQRVLNGGGGAAQQPSASLFRGSENLLGLPAGQRDVHDAEWLMQMHPLMGWVASHPTQALWISLEVLLAESVELILLKAEGEDASSTSKGQQRKPRAENVERPTGPGAYPAGAPATSSVQNVRAAATAVATLNQAVHTLRQGVLRCYAECAAVSAADTLPPHGVVSERIALLQSMLHGWSLFLGELSATLERYAPDALAQAAGLWRSRAKMALIAPIELPGGFETTAGGMLKSGHGSRGSNSHRRPDQSAFGPNAAAAASATAEARGGRSGAAPAGGQTTDGVPTSEARRSRMHAKGTISVAVEEAAEALGGPTAEEQMEVLDDYILGIRVYDHVLPLRFRWQGSSPDDSGPGLALPACPVAAQVFHLLAEGSWAAPSLSLDDEHLLLRLGWQLGAQVVAVDCRLPAARLKPAVEGAILSSALVVLNHVAAMEDDGVSILSAIAIKAVAARQWHRQRWRHAVSRAHRARVVVRHTLQSDAPAAGRRSSQHGRAEGSAFKPRETSFRAFWQGLAWSAPTAGAGDGGRGEPCLAQSQSNNSSSGGHDSAPAQHSVGDPPAAEAQQGMPDVLNNPSALADVAFVVPCDPAQLPSHLRGLVIHVFHPVAHTGNGRGASASCPPSGTAGKSSSAATSPDMAAGGQSPDVSLHLQSEALHACMRVSLRLSPYLHLNNVMRASPLGGRGNTSLQPVSRWEDAGWLDVVAQTLGSVLGDMASEFLSPSALAALARRLARTAVNEIARLHGLSGTPSGQPAGLAEPLSFAQSVAMGGATAEQISDALHTAVAELLLPMLPLSAQATAMQALAVHERILQQVLVVAPPPHLVLDTIASAPESGAATAPASSGTSIAALSHRSSLADVLERRWSRGSLTSEDASNEQGLLQSGERGADRRRGSSLSAATSASAAKRGARGSYFDGIVTLTPVEGSVDSQGSRPASAAHHELPTFLPEELSLGVAEFCTRAGLTCTQPLKECAAVLEHTLERHPVVMLVGPSLCGKRSLVDALIYAHHHCQQRDEASRGVPGSVAAGQAGVHRRSDTYGAASHGSVSPLHGAATPGSEQGPTSTSARAGGVSAQALYAGVARARYAQQGRAAPQVGSPVPPRVPPSPGVIASAAEQRRQRATGAMLGPARVEKVEIKAGLVDQRTLEQMVVDLWAPYGIFWRTHAELVGDGATGRPEGDDSTSEGRRSPVLRTSPGRWGVTPMPVSPLSTGAPSFTAGDGRQSVSDAMGLGAGANAGLQAGRARASRRRWDEGLDPYRQVWFVVEWASEAAMAQQLPALARQLEDLCRRSQVPTNFSPRLIAVLSRRLAPSETLPPTALAVSVPVYVPNGLADTPELVEAWRRRVTVELPRLHPGVREKLCDSLESLMIGLHELLCDVVYDNLRSATRNLSSRHGDRGPPATAPGPSAQRKAAAASRLPPVRQLALSCLRTLRAILLPHLGEDGSRRPSLDSTTRLLHGAVALATAWTFGAWVPSDADLGGFEVRLLHLLQHVAPHLTVTLRTGLENGAETQAEKGSEALVSLYTYGADGHGEQGQLPSAAPSLFHCRLCPTTGSLVPFAVAKLRHSHSIEQAVLNAPPAPPGAEVFVPTPSAWACISIVDALLAAREPVVICGEAESGKRALVRYASRQLMGGRGRPHFLPESIWLNDDTALEAGDTDGSGGGNSMPTTAAATATSTTSTGGPRLHAALHDACRATLGSIDAWGPSPLLDSRDDAQPIVLEGAEFAAAAQHAACDMPLQGLHHEAEAWREAALQRRLLCWRQGAGAKVLVWRQLPSSVALITCLSQGPTPDMDAPQAVAESPRSDWAAAPATADGQRAHAVFRGSVVCRLPAASPEDTLGAFSPALIAWADRVCKSVGMRADERQLLRASIAQRVQEATAALVDELCKPGPMAATAFARAVHVSPAQLVVELLGALVAWRCTEKGPEVTSGDARSKQDPAVPRGFRRVTGERIHSGPAPPGALLLVAAMWREVALRVHSGASTAVDRLAAAHFEAAAAALDKLTGGGVPMRDVVPRATASCSATDWLSGHELHARLGRLHQAFAERSTLSPRMPMLLPQASVRRLASLGSVFQRPGQHAMLFGEPGCGKATLVEQAALAMGGRFVLVESQPLTSQVEKLFVDDLIRAVAGQIRRGRPDASQPPGQKDARRPGPSMASTPLIVAVRASSDHPLSTSLLAHVDILMRTGRHGGLLSGRVTRPDDTGGHSAQAKASANEAAAAARQRDLALRRAFGDVHRTREDATAINVEPALPCVIPTTLHVVVLVDCKASTGAFPGMTPRASELLARRLLCSGAHRLTLPSVWDREETATAVARTLLLSREASLLRDLARQALETEAAASSAAPEATAPEATAPEAMAPAAASSSAPVLARGPRSAGSARGGMFAQRLPSIGSDASSPSLPSEAPAAAQSSSVAVAQPQSQTQDSSGSPPRWGGSPADVLCAQLGRLLADMYCRASDASGGRLSELQESVAGFCRLLVVRRNMLHEGLITARGDLHMLSQKEVFIHAFEQQTEHMSRQLREGRERRNQLQRELSQLDAQAAVLGEELQQLHVDMAERQVPVDELRQHTDAERASVQPFLLEVAEQLKALRKDDIDELRTYVNPPPAVHEALKPVCLLMRGKYSYKDGALPKGLEEPTWREAVALLHQPSLYDDLRTYDMGRVPDKTLAEVKRHTEKRHYDPATLATASLAAAFLSRWVRATVAYATVAQACRPALKKLHKAERVLKKRQSKAAAMEQRLAHINAQRAALQAAVEETEAELDTQETNVSALRQKLSRVRQLSNVTADILKRHRATIEGCQQGLRCILGDVALASGALAYLHTTSSAVVAQHLDGWLQCASVCGIVASPQPTVATLLPFPEPDAGVEAREAALQWQPSTAMAASLVHYARPGSIILIDPFAVTAPAYAAGRVSLLRRHDILLAAAKRAYQLGDVHGGDDGDVDGDLLPCGLEPDLVHVLTDPTAVSLQHRTRRDAAEFFAQSQLAFGVVEAAGSYARLSVGLSPDADSGAADAFAAAGRAEMAQLRSLGFAPGEARGPARGLRWLQCDDPRLGQERLLDAILATVEPGAYREWLAARRASQQSRAKQRAFESDILRRMQSLSDSSFETDVLMEDLQGVQLRASAQRRRHMGKLWGKATLGDKRERYRSLAALGERVFTWLGALAAESEAFVMSWTDFVNCVCQALSSFSPLSPAEGDNAASRGSSARRKSGRARSPLPGEEGDGEALFAGDTYALQAMKEALLKHVLQQLWRKGNASEARTAALAFVLQLLRGKGVMSAAGAELCRRVLHLQRCDAAAGRAQGAPPPAPPQRPTPSMATTTTAATRAGAATTSFIVTDAAEDENTPPPWLAAYGGSWAAARELGYHRAFPTLLRSLRDDEEAWECFLQPGTALLVPAPCEQGVAPLEQAAQSPHPRLQLWERLLLWQILAPSLASQRAWELVVSYLGPIAFGSSPTLARFLEQMYTLQDATGADIAEEKEAQAASLEVEEEEVPEETAGGDTAAARLARSTRGMSMASNPFALLETGPAAAAMAAAARRNRRDVALLRVPASETGGLADTLAATAEAAGQRRWELRPLLSGSAAALAKYSAQRTSGAVNAEVELIVVVCHNPETASSFMASYLHMYDAAVEALASAGSHEAMDEHARPRTIPEEEEEAAAEAEAEAGARTAAGGGSTRRSSAVGGQGQRRGSALSLTSSALPLREPFRANTQRQRAQLVLALMETDDGQWDWRQRHAPLWHVMQRRLSTLVLHDSSIAAAEGTSRAGSSVRRPTGPGTSSSEAGSPCIWLAVSTLRGGHM